MRNQQSRLNDWDVGEVVLTIRRIPGYTILREKINIIMLELKTNEQSKDGIIQQRTATTLDITLALESILTDWKKREAEDATIDVLADVLERWDFRQIANEIRNKHGSQQQQQNAIYSPDWRNIIPNILSVLESHFRNFFAREPISIQPENVPLRRIGGANNGNDRNGQENDDNNNNNVDICSILKKKRKWAIVCAGVIGAIIVVVLSVLCFIGKLCASDKIVSPELMFTKVGQGITSNYFTFSTESFLPTKEKTTKVTSITEIFQSTQADYSPSETTFPDYYDAPVQTINLTVESYDDYQRNAPRIDSNAEVNLHISSKDYSSFQTSTGLYNSGMITNLTMNGFLSLESLLVILNQTVSVTELHLNNSMGGLCSSGQQLVNISLYKAYLPELRKLKLENFTNCENVLEAVVLRFQMHVLKNFNFSGVINDENLAQIQKIIKNAYKSLEVIYFSGSVETPMGIFEFGTRKDLRHVKSIVLAWNVKNEQLKSSPVVHANFCRDFKGLANFELLDGHIDPAQFNNLLKCDELVNITVNILVKEENENKILENTIFELGKHPPFLNRVYLNVHYDSCSQASLISAISDDSSRTSWLQNVPNREVCTFCTDVQKESPLRIECNSLPER